ncbi:MAG TPA: adenosine deaminase [Candidatus Acidoferrum sp.]|nr:adenosine deaminase [Candidatus Acidoferrum sp.]
MSVLPARIATLPKAELHVHLEGSMQPSTVAKIAANHGLVVSEEEVRRRYAYQDFVEFIESFKWVTSFLREPRDYGVIVRDFADALLAQHVVYAEVTLSIGVMQLRGQDPQANFEAMLEAAEDYERRGLRLRWVWDAVRQFGVEAAMAVVEAAGRCHSDKIVAFGIGGDERSIPARDFRAVYGRAEDLGMRRLIHAGEVGGPENIRQAIEHLKVDRIGHGIAAIRDPALMDLLAERQIPLEVCPASNICTGALALQLGTDAPTIEQHPLPKLFRHGVPIVLSTDDPTMFHTTLTGEYENAAKMGLDKSELERLVEMSFTHAFR